MCSGLLHAEHHTWRQDIYLPVWRSRLDLVSAPGQRSSACPKPRPHSDTLKQSRLIQQSISSLSSSPHTIYYEMNPFIIIFECLHCWKWLMSQHLIMLCIPEISLILSQKLEMLRNSSQSSCVYFVANTHSHKHTPPLKTSSPLGEAWCCNDP